MINTILEDQATLLIILYLITFIINIPTGYWRDQQKKLSVKWFIAVHLAVPIVIVLRLYLDIELSFFILLGSLFFYASGQFLGARLNRLKNKTVHSK